MTSFDIINRACKKFANQQSSWLWRTLGKIEMNQKLLQQNLYFVWNIYSWWRRHEFEHHSLDSESFRVTLNLNCTTKPIIDSMTSKLLTSKLFDQKHRTTSIITFLVRIWVGKILVSPASEVRANRAKLCAISRSLENYKDKVQSDDTVSFCC